MIKAYFNAVSPNAKRVAIVAAELGVELEAHEIDFASGQHRTSEYLAINPNGKVPAIDDDGFTLWESAAIAWHLAELNPSKGLLPADIKSRSIQMQWMFWNACHLEAGVSGMVFERLVKPSLGQDTNDTVCDAHKSNVERFLPILNAHLEGRQWIGNQFSVADISLGVTAELCTSVGVELASYPHLQAWLSRLQARPSWSVGSDDTAGD